MDAVYEEVKRIRRHLRLGMGADLSVPVERGEFWRQALALDEQQMKLEQLRRDADVIADEIPMISGLVDLVDGMEKYLGRIWKETEEWFAKNSGSVEAIGHPRLTGFVALNSDTASEFVDFNRRYHLTRRALLQALHVSQRPPVIDGAYQVAANDQAETSAGNLDTDGRRPGREPGGVWLPRSDGGEQAQARPEAHGRLGERPP
jgi:hypothetical protein